MLVTKVTGLSCKNYCRYRGLFKILISEHKPEKEAPNQVYDKTNLAPLFRLLKDSLC